MTEQPNVESTASVSLRNTRGVALAATKQAKLDTLFSNRRYRIVSEIHLTESDEPFKTPLGNTGRNGYLLEEVGNETNRFPIGETALRKAASEYGAVTLPVREKKRRGRPAKVRSEVTNTGTTPVE
jgi:hypothetical protein